MFRKAVVCFSLSAVALSWMFALSQFTVRDKPRSRPADGAALCRCEADCDCGLTHNECPCEEIAKTIAK